MISWVVLRWANHSSNTVFATMTMWYWYMISLHIRHRQVLNLSQSSSFLQCERNKLTSLELLLRERKLCVPSDFSFFSWSIFVTKVKDCANKTFIKYFSKSRKSVVFEYLKWHGGRLKYLWQASSGLPDTGWRTPTLMHHFISHTNMVVSTTYPRISITINQLFFHNKQLKLMHTVHWRKLQII